MRVLEGAPDAGDVLQPHHPVAFGLDGQVEQIRSILEDARHLDRETPLPGAIELPLDRLPEWLESAPPDALVVCASGQRATMAASLLEAAGKRPTVLIEGGADDLAR